MLPWHRLEAPKTSVREMAFLKKQPSTFETFSVVKRSTEVQDGPINPTVFGCNAYKWPKIHGVFVGLHPYFHLLPIYWTDFSGSNLKGGLGSILITSSFPTWKVCLIWVTPPASSLPYFCGNQPPLASLAATGLNAFLCMTVSKVLAGNQILAPSERNMFFVSSWKQPIPEDCSCFRVTYR